MIREQRAELVAWRLSRRHVASAVVAPVSLVLCSLALLVPIERGFPTLQIAGIPFRWPFVVAVAIVAALVALDGRRINRIASRRYCLRHACVVVVLVAGALRSQLPVTAIARVLAYLTAYVLNFIVLTWIFERGHRNVFVVVLSCVAIVAAILGIAEGALGVRPAVYGGWFDNYDQGLGGFEVGLGSGYRVNGTLGNPIIYAMAMVLSLPFIAEIRNRLIRFSATLLLLGAAAFTISKVAVLAILPFLVWIVWRFKLRSLVAFAVGLLAIGVLIHGVSPRVSDETFGGQLLARWVTRLTDPQSVYLSTGLRTSMASLALSTKATTAATVLVGHGLLSESEVSRAVYAGLGTIDNTYLNLYYETGLVGLAAYLYAFGGALWSLRRMARVTMHYWSVVALLIASVVFVSYHYYTFNFLATASLASLYSFRREQSRPVRVGSRDRLHEDNAQTPGSLE
jgi:hypothetical protein